MEPSQTADHQTRLKGVLRRILAEAGELLSLSFPHDYRQHSIITLSQTLKHNTKRLLLALGRRGRKGDEEEEEEEGIGGSREVVTRDLTKEVESTAQSLKKEVSQPEQQQLLFPLAICFQTSVYPSLPSLPHLPPVDECSDGPVVWGLPPATESSRESRDSCQGGKGDHC